MKANEYKILLVDDEVDVLEFLGYNLRKEAYQVFTANNGKDAIKLAKETIPHLIILDIMMPEMDGIETCLALKKIKELNNSIMVFLTARSEDYSQIAGFEAGADDYINKPVKPQVLLSRIKALFRRYSSNNNTTFTATDIITIGELTIDRERHIVINKSKEIHLPRKEFGLLALLASKPNKVFTREEIFSNVWGNDVVVGDRTIDVHIRRLREKTGIDNIKTIKGVGYKFEFYPDEIF